MMKAQFMILWDGLISTRSSCSVIVMGATNRPHDVDHAIRRRMPATFHIGLPSQSKRVQILELILKDENLDPKIDLSKVAEETEHFSGSDLKELCRVAAMIRVKEGLTGRNKIGEAGGFVSGLRSINAEDFAVAVERVQRMKISTEPRHFVDAGFD